MSDVKQQISELCAWNRRLARENADLKREVMALRRCVRQLEARRSTGTDPGIERQAAEILMGAAMDVYLKGALS